MSQDAARLERARREASDWFAELQKRTVTTQAILEFRAWRQEKANDAAYTELETVWRRSGGLAEDPDVKAAVAAALRGRRGGRAPGYLVGPAGRSRAMALFVVLVVLAALLGLLLWRGVTYSTGVGEQRLVRLEDGTRLRLDTGSRVRVRFSGGERHVVLARGRAFFEVAHDAARPFLVEAGGASVRAIGTRFDVRRDPDRVQVTLVEGKVLVRGRSKAGSAWTLSPGQQLVVGQVGPSPALRAVDAEAATSWTTGRLVFRALPLGSAVAEVNRYSRHRVVLVDAALAATPVTGVFDSGDTGAFVAAVEDLYGLKATTVSDGEIVLSAQGGGPS